MSAAAQRADVPGRVIAADEWRLQRWGWLESVRRDSSLSVTARLVAHVLALDFVNVRTMRCDPSYGEIADVIGKSSDTVKRAISELVEARWITRSGGIGRSNFSSYGFVTRASVVRLKGGKNAPLKGGRNASFSGSQKGAYLPGKGGKNASSHNNAEPWKNHGAGAGAPACARARRVSKNPVVQREAERAVQRWRDGRGEALSGLQPWIVDHILGADLLTDDEIARAWPGQGSEGGEADDR